MGLFSKRDRDAYGDYSDETAKENYVLSDEGIIPIGQRQNINHAPHALTADELKGNEPVTPIEDIPMESAGESLYKRMINARKNDADTETDKKSKEIKLAQESLLSRCSPFVGDSNGKTVLNGHAAYSLDSVESIIAEAERKAHEKVMKLYGAEGENEPAAAQPKAEKPSGEELLRRPKAEDIVMRRSEVSNYQYRYADEDKQSTQTEFSSPISDKNTAHGKIKPEPSNSSVSSAPSSVAEEATISFEPIGKKPEAQTEDSTISFTPVTDQEKAPFVGDIGQNIGMNIGEFLPDDTAQSETQPSEEELFGDYETAADAVPIHNELCAKLRKINTRLIFTLLLTLAATAISVLSAGGNGSVAAFEDSALPTITGTALLAVAALINFDVFKSFSAFAGKSTGADLPAAICTLSALIYGVVSLASNNADAPQFTFIACAGLLFSCFGRRNDAKRVLIGFEQIANDEKKFALTLIDGEHRSTEISRDAVEGEALIAAGRETLNITRYLKNSGSPDRFGKKVLLLSLIGVAVAVISAAYTLVTETAFEAIGIFTAVTATAQTLSSTLVGTMPLKMASRRLADCDAMVISENSAELIEQANAVIFDAGGIFPRGRVKMYDMKILSPNNLEKTIFNAAAVTTQINSPLGHVFRRIARTSEDYSLPHADSVKYENRLGVSGWVGDHSLLIGNRTHMETHGVPVPSVEVDKKILRGGYFPVYVASDGRPCALLIIGYEADRDIENELGRLQNMGITLLVNNCDPNITEDMLCDYFGLQEDYVRILQSDSARIYKECTEYRESVSAGAAYFGNAQSLASVITASNRIKKLTGAMSALHIILTVAGLAGAAIMLFSGAASVLTPLGIGAYLLASLNIVCLAPLFYKP